MDSLSIVQSYYEALLNESLFNPYHVAIVRARALKRLEEGEFSKMSELQLYRELGSITLNEFWVFHNWHIHKTLGISIALPLDFLIEDSDEDDPDSDEDDPFDY